MDAARLADLRGWVTEAGLAGKTETAILDGFCRRAAAAGLPIARAMLVIDTLHPVYEGRVFRWRDDAPEGGTQLIEYGPSTEGEVADTWRRSVFFYMVEQGISLVRRRFIDGDPADFGTFEIVPRRRDDRCRRADHPVCRAGGDRRDGLRLFLLVDRPPARLR